MAASWFCGVTTAPRLDCTLARCCESLRLADLEPTVFSEPGSTPTNCHTIRNSIRLGLWHNWLASCRFALQSNPDFILTVQDDSFFHPESREFIESIDWPRHAGFVSLYTPKHYTVGGRGKLRPCGINRIRTKALWGACALVWRPEILQSVITHKIAESWAGARPRSGDLSVLDRRRKNPETIANSDTAIGKICNALGLGMYFVDPSPVAHIARHSTIGHGSNSGRRNAYRIADHSLPLFFQIFGSTLDEQASV